MFSSDSLFSLLPANGTTTTHQYGHCYHPYEAYLSYWDEGTLEDFEERYEGKYNSPEDFAEYLCEECGYFKNLPQWLQCCIDYSAVWRNLDTGGDYTEVDGHIFWN